MCAVQATQGIPLRDELRAPTQAKLRFNAPSVAGSGRRTLIDRPPAAHRAVMCSTSAAAGASCSSVSSPLTPPRPAPASTPIARPSTGRAAQLPHARALRPRRVRRGRRDDLRRPRRPRAVRRRRTCLGRAPPRRCGSSASGSSPAAPALRRRILGAAAGRGRAPPLRRPARVRRAARWPVPPGSRSPTRSARRRRSGTPSRRPGAPASRRRRIPTRSPRRSSASATTSDLPRRARLRLARARARACCASGDPRSVPPAIPGPVTRDAGHVPEGVGFAAATRPTTSTSGKLVATRRPPPPRRRRRPSRSACTSPRRRAPSTSSARRRACPRPQPLEDECAAAHDVVVSLDLRNAVHEHLERPHDVGGQRNAGSTARLIGHLHRMTLARAPEAPLHRGGHRARARRHGARRSRETAASHRFPPESPNAEGITTELLVRQRVRRCAIFLLVEGLLVAFVIRYRRKRRARDADGVQIHGSNRLELSWTHRPGRDPLPDRVFVLVKLPGIADVPGATAGGGPLEIEVVGQQFAWEYRYPNGVVAIDNLRAPAGRRGRLEVTAPDWDVVHSWWIPALGGKIDAIPGRTSRRGSKPEGPGSYKGQCAELCGLHHARMLAQVEVMTQPRTTRGLPPSAGTAVPSTALGFGGVGGLLCQVPRARTAGAATARRSLHDARPTPRRSSGSRARARQQPGRNVMPPVGGLDATSSSTRCTPTSSRGFGNAVDAADGRACRTGSAGKVASWLVTIDHKRIGILYIATAGVFFVLAGHPGAADPLAARDGRTTSCSRVTATTRSSRSTARRWSSSSSSRSSPGSRTSSCR